MAAVVDDVESVAGQPVVVVAGQLLVVDVVAGQQVVADAVAGQPAVAVAVYAVAGQHSVAADAAVVEPAVLAVEQPLASGVVGVGLVVVVVVAAAAAAERVGADLHSLSP